MTRSVARWLLGLASALSVSGCSCDDEASGGEHEAGTLDEAPPGGTSAGGRAGQSGAAGAAAGGDGASGGGEASVPTGDGAVVVAGQGDFGGKPDEFVLAVLDPATGHELSRETLSVAAVHHEVERDLWFIWERRSPSAPSAAQVLHVRRLEPKTGRWTTVSTLGDPGALHGAVPAVFADAFVGVLSGRILYVSVTSNAAPVIGLTLLDTGNPARVEIIGPAQGPLPVPSTSPLLALLAHPGSTIGGRVNLAFVASLADSGEPGLSRVSMASVLVPTSGGFVSEPALVPIGTVPQIGGRAASTVDRATGTELHVFPPPDPAVTPSASVVTLDSVTHLPKSSLAQVTVSGSFLSSADYDPCWEVLFASELATDRALFAIPLRAGAPNTNHRAQSTVVVPSVVFEPFTRTLLAPVIDGAVHAVTAYALTGTPTAPTLEPRTADWAPPADLRPILVHTKWTKAPICP